VSLDQIIFVPFAMENNQPNNIIHVTIGLSSSTSLINNQKFRVKSFISTHPK